MFSPGCYGNILLVDVYVTVSMMSVVKQVKLLSVSLSPEIAAVNWRELMASVLAKG